MHLPMPRQQRSERSLSTILRTVGSTETLNSRTDCTASNFNVRNWCFGRLYLYYIGNGICWFRFLKNFTMMSSGASKVSKPQPEFKGPHDY